jgi:nucleoside 2-deoxyribosyltransferase
MTNEQYARVCLAMVDSADAVLSLPGWDESDGACLERRYALYTGKPRVEYKTYDPIGVVHPREVTRAWLKNDLEEVMGT